jgi:hypothetical protein
MENVLCPHCGKKVELSDAFTHQMKEAVRAEQTAKHKLELEKARTEAEERAMKRVKEELELRLKNSEIEAEEASKRNAALQEQLLELTKEMREVKQKDRERETEMQKQMLKERERMEIEITKFEQEKSRFEKLELQKQLDDTKKALEEAQRKAQQSSQQLQGEVLELELENILRVAFPSDDIVPVGKGIHGADIRQIVKSPRGFVCGTILWESKRTKEWSDKWIQKLKDDLRAEKGMLAAIISIELPKEAENGFGVKDGVWVCKHNLVIPLATILRKTLLDVGYQKAISANRGEKADLLYSYVTSHEFQQQVENIVEVYREMQSQIIRERATLEKSWKLREAHIQKILISTSQIVGSMHGVVGASMPAIKGLELSDGIEEDDQQRMLE